MHYPILKRAVQFFLLLIVIPASYAFSSQDHFPEYDAIKPNVAFWKKIYSEYSSDQGIIHDKYDVDIIYEVIDLIPYDQPDGRMVNKDRMKNSKLKYKEILRELAAGKSPRTPDEIRVADLFKPLKDRNQLLKASNNIRCQVGQKDRFREGLIRSGAYIEEIKQIFVSFGLPVDLAYLPHVESSFNYKAYSKFGAAGIWQFTRATGKQFMRINYAVDERRDPIVSTVAAAKLLKQNYEKLGNWPMAITAYNYGAAGMQKAKDEKGDYESIFRHYRKGWFKFASRNFYSEFLAARDIADNYQTYFGDLTLYPPQQKRKVIMAGYVSISEAAMHLDIDTDDLRKHNPALREPVFLEQKYIPKGYCLLLPMDTEKPLAAEVELPSHIFKPRQKRSEFYRVRRGDTAFKVAKRHGVNLNDLILANNLNRDAVIFVGQNLRIPAKGEKLRQNIKQVPASEKVRTPLKPEIRIAELPEKPSRVIAAVTMPDMRIVQTIYTPPLSKEASEPEIRLAELTENVPHEVGGDMDRSVARHRRKIIKGTSPIPTEAVISGLMEDTPHEVVSYPSAYQPLMPEQQSGVNGTPASDPGISILSKNTHNAFDAGDRKAADETIGRQMREPVNPSVVTGNIEVLGTGKENGKEIGYIQVEVEETIGHYADWLKVTAGEIRRLNGFSFGRMIKLHEKIKVPLHRIDKAQFEERRFEYHKEIEEDFFATYRIDGFQTYKVKKGDNIWSLCYEKFDLPIWLVRNCNVKLDFTNLLASQKLLVPQVIAIQ